MTPELVAAGEDRLGVAGEELERVPGHEPVDGIPSRASSSRIRGTPTRCPNSACENFTGESPRRMLSESES